MSKINQKGFSALEVILVLVIVGLIGGVGYWVYSQNKTAKDDGSQQSQATKEEKPGTRTLAKGTFGDAGEHGTLQLEGYVTTIKRGEGFCEENCKQHDYVFFNITKSENTKIFDYINSMNGNSFVREKAVGIGCVADGKISYSNRSNANGSKSYEFSEEDTAKILAATAEKPVAIELERLELTGGGGAPACYSHFMTIKVL